MTFETTNKLTYAEDPSLPLACGGSGIVSMHCPSEIWQVRYLSPVMLVPCQSAVCDTEQLDSITIQCLVDLFDVVIMCLSVKTSSCSIDSKQ